MSTEERIRGLRGKVFLYGKKQIKVLQTAINGDTVMIATDNDIITFPLDRTDDLINQLMPMEDSAMMVAPIRKKHLTNMTETLIDSIEKIKTNPGYIPQAEAISRQIGTLINIARLSIMMQKNDLI